MRRQALSLRAASGTGLSSRSVRFDEVVKRCNDVQSPAGVDFSQSGLKLRETPDDAIEQPDGWGQVDEGCFGFSVDRPVLPVLNNGQLTALHQLGDVLGLRFS